MDQNSTAEFQVNRAISSQQLRHYVLISLIILLLSLSIFYHQSTIFSDQKNGSEIWLQPGTSNTVPNIDHALISPSDWAFDFEPIERIIVNIKFDEVGALLVNADLATVLQLVSNQLPLTLDVPNIQRVAILLEKMYPGSEGQKLAQIFYNYYLYHQAYQQTKTELSGAANLNEVMFRHEETLKKHYLGEELVRQLFTEKHKLANYLIERKITNQNKQLSKLEKQQKLSDLKDEFLRKKQ